MPFKFYKQSIPDVILVKPKIFPDKRGFFLESYKKKDFINAGIEVNFVQQNHSRSVKGVLRGLHYQKKPYAQSKLIGVIRGKIFDVAVDIRKDSDFFGKYVAVELNDKNNYSLFIPRGFVHGFLVLSEEADVVYNVDNIYSPKFESGLIWNDLDINIHWPIDNPIISDKDKNWFTLKKLIKRDEIFHK